MGIFAGLDADKYDRQYSDSYIFNRIWSYFKPNARRVWIVVGLGLVMSAIEAIGPILIAAGVGALQTDASLNIILLLVAALLVTFLIDYFGNWLRRRLIGRVIGQTIARMRQDALAAAVHRDMAFYDENKSGKILSRITGDTEEFGQMALLTTDIIGQIVQALLLTAILLVRNFWLALVMLAFLPVIITTTQIFRKIAREVTRHGSRAMAAVNDNIQETVSGIVVAKNFRQEAMIYDQFSAVNTQSYNVNMRRGFVLSAIFPVLNALAGLAIGGTLYLGAVIVVGGGLSVSEWYLFIQSVDRFWFPFINISSIGSQFQQAMSAVERVFALIDAENTVQQTDDLQADNLRGHIVFDRMTFEYRLDQPILKDFNLEIKPGESVAFVGHTGAGKSTIIKLITRFYEFKSGRLTIDGTDIRAFHLHSYRRRMGLVPQAPFLFRGTILDNARYARPEATDQEISEIAYGIGGGEWMDSLPDGLRTDVGERGARLSMGQRQLVSLLRVLVQRPAIFVLDEATASVDPFTEAQIQEAIEMILRRSTSILIAHRLSTVRSADRIIVLREGQIIEEGNHESLMAQGGHYAELYDTYFRHQSLTYIETAKTKLADAAR